MSRLRTRSRRRDGNTAMEFALTLPVFIGALGASMDFGWLVYQQTSLDAAADVGCRAGSLIDVGEDYSNLDRVYEQFRARTLSTIQRLGEDCEGCTFEVSLQGEYPHEALVCNATKPFNPPWASRSPRAPWSRRTWPTWSTSTSSADERSPA